MFAGLHCAPVAPTDGQWRTGMTAPTRVRDSAADTSALTTSAAAAARATPIQPSAAGSVHCIRAPGTVSAAATVRHTSALTARTAASGPEMSVTSRTPGTRAAFPSSGRRARPPQA